MKDAACTYITYIVKDPIELLELVKYSYISNKYYLSDK